MSENQLNLCTQEKNSTNNVCEIYVNARQGREPVSLPKRLVTIPSAKIKGMV